MSEYASTNIMGVLERVAMIVFKVFFARKYIKIIFLLFFKNYF
jgi:hypothetical protein